MALAQLLTLDRHQARSLPAALNTHAETLGWPYRCDPARAFDQPELNAMCALWHAKSCGELPPRAAFDMRALKPFVRNVFLMDRIGQKGVWRYRFRLFGSNLVHLFGEHTGRYLDATIRYGAPLRFINYYRTPSQDFLKGEIFAAPLADEVEGQPLVMAATYVNHKDAVHSPLD
jgi:hypothetical protein